MSSRNVYLVTVPAGFEAEAKEEIRRLVPNAYARNMFFKGNILIECPRSVDLTSIAKTKETIYVGKIFPIDKIVKISKSKESIAYIHDEIVQLDKLQKGERFVVRCRRRGRHEFTSQDVERELGSMLEESCGALADLRDPQKIIIVQIFQNQALIGISEASNIVEKKIKVFKKYKHGERPLTRAEHKIREAIKIFGLEIKEDFMVLDLGAAPGGWTKVLANLAGKVVAVDPADLSSSVESLPNVTHLKCKAEEIPKNIGRFNLIVNDMNLDPAKSAKIMVNLAGLLKKGAPALMTIKFVTRNRKKHIAEVLEILKAKYKDFKVKRLPHNRYETTVFMRKA